jgi:hypothetical protein
MAKNSRKHGKKIKLKRRSLPRRPLGYERTGNRLYDLNRMYDRVDLNDPGVRAKIRRDTKGQIEIKMVNGEWRPVVKAGQPIEAY